MECSGRGSVSIPLVADDGDGVAGTDLDDGVAAGLAPSLPSVDVERLGDRMRVPGGPRAGGEVHVAK